MQVECHTTFIPPSFHTHFFLTPSNPLITRYLFQQSSHVDHHTVIITGTTALDEDDPHNFLAALFKKEFTVRKQYRSPLHSSYTRYMKFHPGYRDDDVMSHGSPWFQRHVLGKEAKHQYSHHDTTQHNTT